VIPGIDADGMRLVVMDADGTGAAPLGQLRGWAPAWSPDGTWIAFSVGILLMNPEGGDLRFVRQAWPTRVTWVRPPVQHAPARARR
jgi:Tol biopolymer transport system component